jgi:hypothetical protein
VPRYQSFLDADAHSSLKGLHSLDQVCGWFFQ